MQGLVFKESSHRYRMDGKHVTGVTTILGGGIQKPCSANALEQNQKQHPKAPKQFVKHSKQPGAQPHSKTFYANRCTQCLQTLLRLGAIRVHAEANHLDGWVSSFELLKGSQDGFYGS